jgi:spectrin beta
MLFKKQKADEEAAKQAEKERIEKERIEALKQKEVQRITEERRRQEKQMEHVIDKPPIFSGDSQKQQVSIVKQSASNEDVPSSVAKSNSFVNIFGDRLRRGSDGNVKRAESMKVAPKAVKHTPSFTTRRRAASFRKLGKGGTANVDQSFLPPVEIQGTLDRKHELQSGGKRAPVRSWKQFHTVLCGQLLCFFKDVNDFIDQKAATAPVNILDAKCEKAENYTKKKNVFRLRLHDGSEFLFEAPSYDEMNDWVNKICFHANLPPNLQLMSYDESMKQNLQDKSQISPSIASSSPVSTSQIEHETTSISSHASSPDSQRRDSRGSHASGSTNGSNSMYVSSSPNPTTPQMNFLQKQKELREQAIRDSQLGTPTFMDAPPHSPSGFYDKPPIPPRGVPPLPPQRQSSYEKIDIQIRQKNINSNDGQYNYVPVRPYSLQPQSRAPLVGTNDKNDINEEIWKRHFDNEPSGSGWGQTRFEFAARTTSLPPHSMMQPEFPPQLPSHHRMSAESSSESEASGMVLRKDGKDKDKKGVFRIFSKKKSKSSQ